MQTSSRVSVAQATTERNAGICAREVFVALPPLRHDFFLRAKAGETAGVARREKLAPHDARVGKLVVILWRADTGVSTSTWSLTHRTPNPHDFVGVVLGQRLHELAEFLIS